MCSSGMVKKVGEAGANIVNDLVTQIIEEGFILAEW